MYSFHKQDKIFASDLYGCLQWLAYQLAIVNSHTDLPLIFYLLLKDLKWLPVRQQLYYRHAIMAFKCMSGYPPASLFSKYIQRAMITRRTTRNSQMLNIPLYKTAPGQRAFYFRTVEFWNSLHSTLKLKPTLQNFKRCLKRCLISIFLVT